MTKTFKKCSKCQIEKETTEFGKDKSRKDFLNMYCKECVKIITKKYVEENKEKHRAAVRGWQRANPKKFIANIRKWQSKNKDKLSEYSRRYYLKKKQKKLDSSSQS